MGERYKWLCQMTWKQLCVDEITSADEHFVTSILMQAYENVFYDLLH
jgi:hypothetical protein